MGIIFRQRKRAFLCRAVGNISVAVHSVWAVYTLLVHIGTPTVGNEEFGAGTSQTHLGSLSLPRLGYKIQQQAQEEPMHNRSRGAFERVEIVGKGSRFDTRKRGQASQVM